MDKQTRIDFEQAMGETFGAFICPPIPWDEASPHECCEVIWQVAGRHVTPAQLAACTEAECAQLAAAFGQYFNADAPTVEQIKAAIAALLARWPVDSSD